MRPTISTFLRFLPVVIVSPAVFRANGGDPRGGRRPRPASATRRRLSALTGMVFREAIESDALDLLALAGRAAAETGHDLLDGALQRDLAALGNDYLAQERHLEAAAMTLRRAWLERRPSAGRRQPEKPGRRRDRACALRRGPAFRLRARYRRLDAGAAGSDLARRRLAGSSDLVLFRSGQAALACLLQFAAAHGATSGPLIVAHAGAYFETASLLASWPRRAFRPTPATAAVPTS